MARAGHLDCAAGDLRGPDPPRPAAACGGGFGKGEIGRGPDHGGGAASPRGVQNIHLDVPLLLLP